MTIEIAAMVAAEAAAIARCEDLAHFALGWGKWFIRLAFLAAVLSAVIAVAVGLFRKDGDGKRPKLIGATAWLEALKGALQALATLPAWVAIYLAGLGLLWAAVEAPKRCVAPPQTPAPQEAPKP